MRMPLSSRILFTFVGLALPLGAHMADFFSKTHIFNDRWPPHAKFHTGQTLSMSIFLGLMTIAFAWRRTSDKRTTVFAAIAFSAAYAITQMTAILYPGTAFYDPEFVLTNGLLLGLPRQIYFNILSLAITALASWLALRRSASWSD
jgi:hypothetical protein